jgi:hypothetical protein
MSEPRQLVDGEKYRVTLSLPTFRTIGTFTVTVHLSGMDVIVEFKNGQRILIPAGTYGHPCAQFEEIAQ